MKDFDPSIADERGLGLYLWFYWDTTPFGLSEMNLNFENDTADIRLHIIPRNPVI